MNDSERKASENTEDLSFLSETGVLEALTDEDIAEEPEYLGETGVLETLTVNDAEKDEKHQAPEEDEEEETNPVKEILLFLRDLAICMAIVYAAVEFLIRPIQVEGSSMYPTLHENDLGVSNLLGYRMNSIDRFDIAIIYLESGDKYLVKRVIGLPGETVSYLDGQLYVDGVPVDEPFLENEYAEAFEGRFMEDVAPVTLAEDEYYCLGDNRPRSSDSRFYGPFKKDMIISKGAFILWPLSDFGVRTW